MEKKWVNLILGEQRERKNGVEFELKMVLAQGGRRFIVARTFSTGFIYQPVLKDLPWGH